MGSSSPFFTNLDDNLVFMARVFKDAEPAGFIADVVYLFGQTSDNEDSPIEVGAELWHTGRAALVGIGDCETGHGYPGFAVWHAKLRKLGVPPTNIVPVKISSGVNVNTLTESITLVLEAKKQGWRKIFMSAAPVHQLRAFLTVVNQAVNLYPEVLIYNKAGRELWWDEYVSHSQGITEGKRSGILYGEFDRIRDYYVKGHLSSFPETLSYIHSRDHYAKIL